jgi:hypothetical protein
MSSSSRVRQRKEAIISGDNSEDEKHGDLGPLDLKKPCDNLRY